MFVCFSQNLQTLILPINSVLRKREFWGLSDNFALITDGFSAAPIRPSLTGGLSRAPYGAIRTRTLFGIFRERLRFFFNAPRILLTLIPNCDKIAAKRFRVKAYEFGADGTRRIFHI